MFCIFVETVLNAIVTGLVVVDFDNSIVVLVVVVADVDDDDDEDDENDDGDAVGALNVAYTYYYMNSIRLDKIMFGE